MRSLNRPWLPFLLLPVLSTPAFACINDRDTLEEEAKAVSASTSTLAEDAAALGQASGEGLPHVVRVITGRFDRNPALYYEMRLQRVAAALKSNPGQLELYDDAAVACDRVGRSGEAISWIEKKRARLVNLGDAAPKEQWYRYYANVGTFWAHRWLRDGAAASRIDEMKTASDYIRQAIEIKPNAHFGREKYQLKAMEWILASGQGKIKTNTPTLSNALGLRDAPFGDGGHHGRQWLEEHKLGDAISGLSGLIALGNAWESVDVFEALSTTLRVEAKESMAALAALRVEELVKTGRYSLAASKATDTDPALSAVQSFLIDTGADRSRDLRPIYQRLRREGDEYVAQRTAYMMERLTAGRHPDTDATFWQEWQEPYASPLDGKASRFAGGSAWLILGVGLAASLGTLRVVRLRRRG